MEETGGKKAGKEMVGIGVRGGRVEMCMLRRDLFKE
jgi:hypothetical protein